MSKSFAPTTQHMDGNPHFELSLHALREAAEKVPGSAEETSALAAAQTYATLALAFEQRSQTLVELRKDKFGLIRSVQAIQDRILGGLDLK
ncbi:hypothetical protein SEA_OTTAWA_17 [Arthrobacter phage Ottawa]|nr:hypothetical protein SEA_KHARCHO_17 [Arthrobacter phage Kharcho]WIC89249.1 hypothetical protein SEA_OTTAWA_17 [Arthrobacter phage Ottawa]